MSTRSPNPSVVFAGLLVSLFLASTLLAQGTATGTNVLPQSASIGGVYIDPTGGVRYRQVDRQGALKSVREQGKQGAGDEPLCFVSLPKAFAEARRLLADNQPIPRELRYLGGITQLRYILVYPEEGDLLIAGRAEEMDTTNPLQPVGKQTGRPVLQLDDLVFSLRNLDRQGRMAPFGCSIDPQGDALAKSKQVMEKHGRRSSQQLIDDMKQTLGPHVVTFFGPTEQTRAAFVCVAADYKLKRLALGLDPSPVGGAMDNTRTASARFWFETSYEPLLVSEQSDAYELRGPRLALKAGAQSFDERGATDTAKHFAEQFSQKMPQMASAVPLFADLSNLADLSVLATLIRTDELDKKISWDLSWLKTYPIPQMAVPKTAETLVAIRSGSLVAGGVRVDTNSAVAASSRQKDEKNQLGKIRQQLAQLRQTGGGEMILRAK